MSLRCLAILLLAAGPLAAQRWTLGSFEKPPAANSVLTPSRQPRFPSPLEDADGNAIAVLAARPGYFDSWLVEPGPPALLTEHGIVLLYNAGNSGSHGDSRLPDRMYSAGQALFDPGNPIKLIDRTAEPFIRPTEPYERTGQYVQGTTFVEGLVRFAGKWFLYYGTADSRVGVAVANPQR